MCYWQIDFMIRKRSYGQFPLIENIKIVIPAEELNREVEDNLGGLNLKKQFKLPPLFCNPNILKPAPKPIETKGYRFFIPNNYVRNQDKNSECYNKDTKENLIVFHIRDRVPIDFLDKMPDRERDLKLMCDDIADYFLKN